MRTILRFGCALLLLCSVACDDDVNLDAVPGAAAGCEPPSADNLVPEAPMLPGRHCIACHQAGGQADRLPWSAAGTVFPATTSPCNSDGLEGVTVQIADETRKILITLTTNRSGNFFTAEPLQFHSIIARVSKDGKVREMQTPAPNADCPSCHYPGGAAGGRIFLD